MSKNPLLKGSKVAAPCSVGWENMQGDDTIRFCQQCQQNVYNLSEIPADEAEELIRRKEGKLCVRLYVRNDGTVMTNNCPVGLRTVRRVWMRTLVRLVTLLVWCGILRPADAQGLVGAPVDGPRYSQSVITEAVNVANNIQEHSQGILATTMILLKFAIPQCSKEQWWQQHWHWVSYVVPFACGALVEFIYLGWEPSFVVPISFGLARSGETGVSFGVACFLTAGLYRKYCTVSKLGEGTGRFIS